MNKQYVVPVISGGGGAGGSGTVASVAMTVPTELSVSGSPITTSGTLALTWGAASGNKIVASPADGSSGAYAGRALVALDIPNLAASKITSGVLALAQGGNTFSLLGDVIYGGVAAAPTVLSGNITATKMYLSQTGSGAVSAAPAWAQINYADMTGTTPTPPSGTVLWSALGNAGAALTLANAGNATTFSQTSAVTWGWNNTTTATSGGVTASSPIISLGGRLFSSGVDTAATWTAQNLMSPTTALVGTISNAVETSGSVVTLTIGAHSFVVGNMITCINLSTFTWLNNQNARITAIAATTISFTDPTTHGTQGSAAQTGTVVQIPTSTLPLTPSGSAGDSLVIIPAGGGLAGSSLSSFGFQFAGQPAHTGFALDSTSQGGLSIATIGGAGVTALKFYTGAVGAVTAKGTISVGDSSAGNSTVQLSASASNFSVELRAVCTTNVTNPCVLFGNNSNLTATANNQIGFGFGYTKNASTSMVFAPTSGTATFQALVNKYSVNQTGGANGAVTGLLVNAVETAVGGTHLLLDLQAGATGGTSEFAVNNTGIVTKYNAITTVSNGVPGIYGTADLTAQTAAKTATTLYTPTATGLYRISVYLKVTTVASASSVLGGTTGVTITYTDGTDSVAQSVVARLATQAGAAAIVNAGNTTATSLQGEVTIYAKTGVAIQYAIDYTSVNAAEMAYEAHLKAEAL